MKIEVSWKTSPASGITNIDLDDLGCKNKKEWGQLPTKEQEKRLSDALMVYDGGELVFNPTEW